MSVTLYGWPPMFGAQSPSPLVIKAHIQLQMLGVEYLCAIAELENISKQKAPYVMDDGELIQDSTFIRWHFEKKLGKDLDASLSPEQRATAWGLERMLEDQLYHINLIERWLEDDNFERGPAHFFVGMPEDVRERVIEQVRADIRSSLIGHGILRHSREERMQLATRDIAMLAIHLGDKPYMFGDAPTALDGAGFGFVDTLMAPVFKTELVGIVGEHDNLVAYHARMKDRFFATSKWPAEVMA